MITIDDIMDGKVSEQDILNEDEELYGPIEYRRKLRRFIEKNEHKLTIGFPRETLESMDKDQVEQIMAMQKQAQYEEEQKEYTEKKFKKNPEATIERSDVEDTSIQRVAEHFGVELKGFGTRMTGLCPVHGEKTPSFTIYLDSNSFYCYGCGIGGSVIDLVMEIKGLTYPEALSFLYKF